MHALRLRQLPWHLAVCRLAADAPIPGWALSSSFFSATRTSGELSLVCDFTSVPPGIDADGPWSIVQIEGPLPLTMIGVLASLLHPLAAASISVFVLSTFETDYVLVREAALDRALTVLRTAGHEVLS